MNSDFIIGLVLASLLLVYLIVALIFPDRF